MKLSEYVDKYDVNKSSLARKLGVSRETFYNLLKDWADPRAQMIHAIDNATNGEVKYEDWLPNDQT